MNLYNQQRILDACKILIAYCIYLKIKVDDIEFKLKKGISPMEANDVYMELLKIINNKLSYITSSDKKIDVEYEDEVSEKIF